jgi:alcohol dehydrogenase
MVVLTIRWQPKSRGIHQKDFPAMIKAAFAEAHGIYAVPKYMDHNEANQILHALK